MTKNTLLLKFALLISISNFGQTILVNGEASTGKLKWDDFTGKIDKGSTFNAYTSYKFNTKTGSIRFVGDSVVMNGFDVILEFDAKNSWAKMNKVTDELLVHEQGHFNFGILCVREIMAKYKQARFTKANFSIMLQNIIDETNKKYVDMGVKYDQETDHSKNTEQQTKWNSFFAEKLGSN